MHIPAIIDVLHIEILVSHDDQFISNVIHDTFLSMDLPVVMLFDQFIYVHNMQVKSRKQVS